MLIPCLNICHTGLCERYSSMACLSQSAAVVISSSVVGLPKLILKDAFASGADNPMANKTWEGEGSAELHAEPEDMAIFVLSFVITASLSTCNTFRFVTVGNRCS